MIQAPYWLVLILCLIAYWFHHRASERALERRMRQLIREELADMFPAHEPETYNVVELSGAVGGIDRSPHPYWRNRNVETSA